MKANTKCAYSGHHTDEGQDQTLFMDRYYEYEVSHTGITHTKYADPDNPNINFSSRCGATGELEHHDMNNGKPVSQELYPHAHRHYTNNHSTHSQKNREKYSGGVYNKNTSGQHSKTTKQDDMDGAANNSLALFGNEGRVRKSQGSNWVNTSDNGIHIQTSQGESYNYHSGNLATTVAGAQYKISQADVGHHVQKQGNWDTRVENGKLQLQTGKGELRVKSGSTMMINAASKITIQVGGSTITVESGQVTVNSQTITLNGTCYLGGQGGQLCGTCGGGCATKVHVV